LTEYQDTKFIFNNFSPKILLFKRIEKYGRSKQATDDIMEYAH